MGHHTDAQNELADAFREVFGRNPTVNERLFAGAIALGESGYSRAQYTNKLTGESKVLNNWGAIQCGHKPPCGENCFEVSDYDVLPDGSHKPFNWCYRDDPTRAIAARVFIETLYKKRPKLLDAASSVPSNAYNQLMALTGVNKVGDPAPLYDGKGSTVSLSDPHNLHVAWFSHVMRDSGYYGLELIKHIGAQLRYHSEIGKETGEYVDGGSPGTGPKVDLPVPVYYLQLSVVSTSRDVVHVHEGMQNDESVRVLQRGLLTKGFYKGRIDGDYGPLTEQAVRYALGIS